MDTPLDGVIRLTFACRKHLRSNGFVSAGLRAFAVFLWFAMANSCVSDESRTAETPDSANRPVTHGRRVTLRITADDPDAIPGITGTGGVYDFAVRLTSDIRRFGVSRIILPDPEQTDRPEEWLAVARHAATMGFDVRFEIAPSATGQDPAQAITTENLPKTLEAGSAASLRGVILKRITELAELKNASGARVASGFFVALAPPAALPAGWEAGSNEATFADFLRETGLESDWGGRLTDEASRRDFIKSRGLMPWLTWRSRRIATFYAGLADEIEKNHALPLTIAAPHPGSPASQALYEEAERIGSSPVFAWRWMAFEPELWRNSTSVRLIGAESVSVARSNRDWATHPDLEAALGPQATQGHFFAGSAPGLPPENSNDANEYDALKSAMVSHLSRHDATGLIVDRSTLGEMHADFTSWVTRFEGLPETGRRAWETLAPKPGLTLRSYHSGDSELLVPINPLPCAVGLELTLVRRAVGDAEPVNPDSDLKLTVESTGPDRALARLSIPPVHVGRLDLGRYSVESYRVDLPQESRDVIRTRYDALIRQKSEPAEPRGALIVEELSDTDSKTRGRRLMAALQAYRDMRLADFFRLSDGMSSDRHWRRNSEITPDVGRVDLPKRRIIR